MPAEVKERHRREASVCLRYNPEEPWIQRWISGDPMMSDSQMRLVAMVIAETEARTLAKAASLIRGQFGRSVELEFLKSMEEGNNG